MTRTLPAALALTLLWTIALPDAEANDSPYGVCVHLAGDAALDEVQRAGITWVRADFDWWRMEPSDGGFDWSGTDRFVNGAVARNLQVFATLAYTPGWANGNQHHSVPPHRLSDWSDFVTAVVTRYRDRVKHWGMWNEPNLSHFFSGSRAQYIDDILIPGAQAAKQADPSCLVLGPELAHMDDWHRWLRDVLGQASGHIDIVTHHIYKSPPSKAWRLLDGWTWPWEGPWPNGNVKSLIQRHGGAGKPVWLTETGWRSASHGEQTQARYLEEFMDRFARQSWLDKVFFYQIHDEPNSTDGWGLLRADLSRKPAMDAYARFILTHPAPTTLPPAPPTPIGPPQTALVFEAEALNHHVGRQEADGWSASTPLDDRGHMTFGPYTALVPAGQRTASYRLQVDDVTATNHVVVTIDVFDATTGQVLAVSEVRRHAFTQPHVYQDLELTFTSPGQGHQLEFRTYWHDTSHVCQDKVTVR